MTSQTGRSAARASMVLTKAGNSRAGVVSGGRLPSSYGWG